MFKSILAKLGFGGRCKRETVTTVRLDVIAEQVREFNEAKKQINNKIETLEERTDELDQTVAKTLDMTRENQNRLDSIEESLKRMVSLSENIIKQKSRPKEEEQK